MFGPESTATGLSTTSVERRSPVAGSSPFVSDSTGASPGSALTTSPKTALGTATTISSAAPIGAASIVAAATPLRVQCLRESGLRCVSSIARACSASRQASVTSCSRFASTRANAVPHEPPPTTTTLIPRPRRRAASLVFLKHKVVLRPHEPASLRGPTELVFQKHNVSRALNEVDRDRHAGEVKPFAQLVLDPVGVVARDEARVVDVDPDPRRPGRDLGAVEQVEPLPLRGRRLPRLAQLRQGVVERRRRDPAGVLLEQVGDVDEQPVEAAAGLRGDGDQ